MASKQTPIAIEIHYVGDRVNLVVPPQSGLDFDDVAPRLAAFARELAATLGKEVEIEGEPERHLNTPEHLKAHAEGRLHSH